MTIERLLDATPNKPINLLLYGDGGTGKTAYAGSNGDRTLIVDIGDSRDTLYSPWYQNKYHANPLLIVVSEQFEDGSFVPKGAEAYDKVCDLIDEALEKYGDQFNTVVIDDLSSLQDFAMNKALELANKYKGSGGLDKSRSSRIPFPEQSDYGTEMELTEKFINGTRDLLASHGKHFLVTAHTTYIYGKPAQKGGEPTLRRVIPAVTGKSQPDRIPRLFSNVWRSEVVGKGANKQYRIHTMGDEIYMGKSRYGGLFKEIETDLTFPTMVERISSHIKKLQVENERIQTTTTL